MFVMDNLDKLKLKNITNIGAQYLLTILRDYYNLSSQQLGYGYGKRGYYYIHYGGDEKYMSPIVPNDVLLIKNNKKGLF